MGADLLVGSDSAASSATKNFAAGSLARAVVGWLNVMDPRFGAVGDGTTDDSAAVQAAINAMLPGDVLVFPPGKTFLINTGVTLPTSGGAGHAAYEFRGYGATLKTTATTIAVLGDAVPANTTALVANAARKLHFRGFRFVGTTLAGQTGLKIMGSYGLVVEDCTLDALGTGIDLALALMGECRSCFFTLNLTYDVCVRSAQGEVTGATLANSASNQTTLYKCRSYAKAAQTAQFAVLGSDSVTLDSCITEGNNPASAILFDDGGSTVVKQFTVRNHHFENTPSGAHVALTQTGGAADFENLWVHTSGTMIDASASGASLLITVDCPQVGATTYCKHNPTANTGPQWYFHPSGAYGAFDPTLAASWVGAVVPTRLFQLGFTSAFGNQDGMLQANGSLLVQAKTGSVAIGAPGKTVNVGVTVSSPLAQLHASAAANDATIATSYGLWWRDETTKQVKLRYKDNADTARTLALPYTQTKLTNQTVNAAGSSIAHTLGYTPTRITIEPTSAGQIWRSAVSDSTNIYLTADVDGRTCDIYVG